MEPLSEIPAAPRREHLGAPLNRPLHLEPPPWSQYAGTPALAVAAVLATASAVWLELAGQRGWAITLGVVAATCALAAAVQYLRRGRCFATLQLFEHGVVVARGRLVHTILFGGLRQVTLRERQSHVAGDTRWIQCQLVLEDDLDRVVVHTRSAPHEYTLGPWLRWLLAVAAEHLERASPRLRGRGWRLDKRGLHRGDEEPVPLARLTQSVVVGRRLHLWRDQDERPFFQISLDSRNAVLLGGMARRQVDSSPVRRLPGLGRRISSRRPNAPLGAFVVFIGLLSVAVAVVTPGIVPPELLPDSVRPSNLPDLPLALGAVALLLALWAFVQGAQWISRRVTVHEAGVRSSDLRRRQELHAVDVAALRFSATRQTYSGFYFGTAVKLAARPDEGRPFKVAVTAWRSAADLELLRDVMAAAIADRWEEVLEDDEDVPWVDARLRPETVRFARRRTIGRGPEVEVEYADLRYKFAQGTFHLFAPRDDVSSLRMKCGAWNFYPGFHVMLRRGQDWGH